MTPKTISKLKSKCDSDYKSDLIQSDVKVLYEITSGNLFRSLDFEGDGHILKKDIVDALESRGILMSDPRIKDTVKQLSKFKDTESINPKQFHDTIVQNITLIERALKGDLIIPDFPSVTGKIKEIFEEVASIKRGEVADYIPQLARVNPNYYAISICSVDGQQFHLGDNSIPYSIQSTSKPINYSIALEEFGEKKVHKHIGREPSGRGFNELTLNKDGLPHNPMINAGAIMSCALIRPDLNISDRFDHVLSVWGKLSGGGNVGFNNSIYLSEKQTADRNFALAYFMRESNAFPEGTDMLEVLDFYFQGCSIQIDCASHAVVAGTLANAGICPITRERVFSPTTTKNCLSLMYSCGMYDFSGEFAFTVGIPAKSGVSGALVVVVPGVCGITIWSPPLDQYGNSVRAVEICNRLVEKFNFHNYDNLIPNLNKIDPKQQKNEDKMNGVMVANFAASQGDLNEIKSLKAKGLDLNEADYDGRTPIHIAASEGHSNIVEFFILENLELAPKDRWGGTPLDDAIRHEHKSVISLLERTMRKSKNKEGQS
ncbi:MAG: glutaminase A [Candidatus Margulisbacteria bacterium]|nr:glutaminase A [Candidatus Margulisiibacteriota bacterium]